MDNKSFEQPSEEASPSKLSSGGGARDDNNHSDTSDDEAEEMTMSGADDDQTLPISEVERMREIQKYKDIIKSLECSSSSSGLDRRGAGGGGAMYPSSSRSPLNAQSTLSLANTLSDSSTMDVRTRRRPKKDLPLDYGRDIVLLNSFKVGRQRHHVYLNEGQLIWEKERRGDSLKDIAMPDAKAPASYHRQIVPLEDVICVKPVERRGRRARESAGPSGSGNEAAEGLERATEGDAPEETTFQLHYARRRTRNPNIWKDVAIKFHNSDPRIVAKWVTTLRDIVGNLPQRPRHILMFVNPYGGKRIAMNIYNRTAKPLFQLAEVDVSLVVTQRQNQVTDFIMSNYLEQYDGIVCCGGDGTFNELYNGLVRREIAQQGTSEKRLMNLELPRPRIPIGVIPGGSTNTISYCLNGTDDVRTAVLNIILGKVDGMDLSSVHRNNSERELLRLCASVCSYGFLGDVAKEAEHYRQLGPRRYDYVGVKKFFKNSGYEAEIKILTDAENNNNEVAEGCKCLEGCERCTRAARDEDTRDFVEQLRRLDGVEPGERWKVIRGRYFMISGANISCACERSPQGLSPYCHIGDGCLDLILVKHSSFWNNLRLASRLSATGAHISSLPFVETYRTRAFTFSVPVDGGKAPRVAGPTTAEPSINASTVPITEDEEGGSTNNSPNKSSWNCDGEVIEETDLLVRTHCQLVQVYRAGIRNRDARKDCCGLC